MSKNYYEILGIGKSATKEQIKKAFYSKAKIYHPDVNHASYATDIFRQIEEAYQTLYDDNKRREYDLSQLQSENRYQTYPTDNRQQYQNYSNNSSNSYSSNSSNQYTNYYSNSYSGSRSQTYTNYYSNSSSYARQNTQPKTYTRKEPTANKAPAPKPDTTEKKIRKAFLSPVYFFVVIMEKTVILLGGLMMVAGVILFGLGIVMGIYNLVQNAPLNPDIIKWFLISLAGILIFLLPTIVIKGIKSAKNYLHDVFFE